MPLAEADVSTFNPLAGDGFVIRTTSSGCDVTTWNNIHGLSSGAATYTSQKNDYVASTGCNSQARAFIHRGFLAFDTSSIPDDAVVTDAVLKLYVHKKFNALDDGNDFIAVVEGRQASATSLVGEDFDMAGSSITDPVEGSERMDISAITTGGYNTWTLNSAGLSWISLTGQTKLALREGHDIQKIYPAYTAGQYNGIGYYLSEQITSNLIPVLEVTYTTGSGGSGGDTGGGGTPDTEAPTVSVSLPLDGTYVSGSTNVVASASDNVGVEGVQFKLDGSDLGPELTTGFNLIWNTSSTPEGSHTISATARDAAGNTNASLSLGVVVDNTPPTTDLTSHLDGSTVANVVTLTASASDNNSVVGVQFKVDGSSVGSEDLNPDDGFSIPWDTSTVANGSHTLTAIARDVANNTASSTPVSLSVDNVITAVVKGDLSYASCNNIFGWSFDSSSPNTSNQVEVSVDSVPVATLTTSLLRADINSKYTITGNHGFTWLIPSQYKDGNPHTFSVKGYLMNGGSPTLLNGSSKTITCGGPLPNAPNIVLILTDDQVWHTAQHMPLTNAVFDTNGVKFTNATVSTPLCCPSRSTILSGQYVRDTGVYRNDATLFNDTTTIATIASGQGYYTGFIGKYLNNYGSLGSHVAPGWDIWKVFNEDPPAYYHYYLNENGEPKYYSGVVAMYQTDVLTNKAVEFINNAPSSKPLLLYWNPYAPHPPATPAKRHTGMFSSFPDWRPLSYNEADVSDKPTWVKKLSLLSESKQGSEDSLHRRMLESLQAVDEGIKKIADTLAANGRLGNTVFIFTSDNGFSWGEHRWTVKKCVYEECIRVPFMVRAPGLTSRTDASLVQNIDIVPTFLDYMGVSDPSMDGMSLKPLLENSGSPWRTESYIEYAGDYDTTPNTRAINVSNFVAIRTDQYVYAKYKNGNMELYDLFADPYQLTNIVNDPTYASMLTDFDSKLHAFNPDPFATPPNPQYNIPGSGE